MSDGRIITGDELSADLTVECDVCVVGSGAGGGWVAHELVKAGKRVVMLEEGGYSSRAHFDQIEARAYRELYQELAGRSTDDQGFTVLQGRSVGGGTTVNWCSCFRTPERILNAWRERFGLQTLSTDTLTPHFEAIERRLRVAEWPLERINENNRVLWDGLGKLGYSRGLIRRNVNNCLDLGSCGLGCPIDAKQSTLATVIPDSVERGMTLYANTSARVIEWAGRRVSAVRAEVLSPSTHAPTGVRLTVKPKVVVVSGGAINSPALLLRSGLEAEGRVGLRTWFHPVAVMLATFGRQIRPFSGAPQSVYSHHFVDRGPGRMGYFLEVPPIHPLLAATTATAVGSMLQDQLSRLAYINAMLAICVDGLLPHEEGATVRLREGARVRHSIKYHDVPELWEAVRDGCKEMARIQFAAGAEQVVSLHLEPVVLNSPEDISKLDRAPWGPVRLRLATAHQMGGCPAGSDPRTSVVDPYLRFHELDNLFIVDGSVFPTSLGVNPQETIFAIARWAGQNLAAA